jgi:RimJ/RimL family protein N-acetyltransferase
MGRWAVIGKRDGLFYGWCGLKKIGSDVDLGYRFFRRYWGQGIASETALASRDYGFEHYRLERLVAHAAIANSASVRVLEKLGFRRVGETTLGVHQAIGFELLRSQWLGQGA